MSVEKFNKEDLVVHLYEAQEFIADVLDTEEGDVGHNHITNMIDALSQACYTIESPKEVRVYAVDDGMLMKPQQLYSDEEFIALSEEDGNVWSLEGFQREHNSGDLFISNYTIRFI